MPVEDDFNRHQDHSPQSDSLAGGDQSWRMAMRILLVVAAGTGRRAAELGIAGSAQCGRTIWISVRIAVVRMQGD